MKMNKIVLASLLSVSLLGASTSVFAAEQPVADNATTTTEFKVENGTLSFAKDADGTTKSVTPALKFTSAGVADLLSGAYSDSQDFTAKVTDTTGNPEQGWTLTANYTPLTNVTGTKTNYLGETLTIGAAALTADNSSAVAYSATADEDAAALKTAKGTIENGGAKAAKLDIKAGTAAVAGTYTGKIDWVLQAAPAN